MTHYECGYCDYDGKEEPMKGHLLSKHDINAFQEPIWRHAEMVSEEGDALPEHRSEDQTLQQFMEEHEGVETESVTPEPKTRLGRLADSIRNLFN